MQHKCRTPFHVLTKKKKERFRGLDSLHFQTRFQENFFTDLGSSVTGPLNMEIELFHFENRYGNPSSKYITTPLLMDPLL